MIPPKVLAALRHVRQTFPDVVMVVFGADGRWQYMSDVFVAPKWTANDKSIDINILEEAADEVDSTVGFPAVFQLEEKQ